MGADPARGTRGDDRPRRGATDREARPVLARGPTGDGPGRRAARTGCERRAGRRRGGRSVSLALTATPPGGQDQRTDITAPTSRRNDDGRSRRPADGRSTRLRRPHAGGTGRDRTDLTAQVRLPALPGPE